MLLALEKFKMVSVGCEEVTGDWLASVTSMLFLNLDFDLMCKCNVGLVFIIGSLGDPVSFGGVYVIKLVETLKCLFLSS